MSPEGKRRMAWQEFESGDRVIITRQMSYSVQYQVGLWEGKWCGVTGAGPVLPS